MRAVLEDIHSAVAKQAADIVGPVIDKAEQDGKLTGAQADKLRDAIGNLVGGKPHGGPPPMLPLRDADVRDVLHDAFEAIAASGPAIAKPIIDKAEADKKITEAQANQLRKHAEPARAASPASASGTPPAALRASLRPGRLWPRRSASRPPPGRGPSAAARGAAGPRQPRLRPPSSGQRPPGPPLAPESGPRRPTDG